jgi:hypothetical protein
LQIADARYKVLLMENIIAFFNLDQLRLLVQNVHQYIIQFDYTFVDNSRLVHVPFHTRALLRLSSHMLLLYIYVLLQDVLFFKVLYYYF